MKILFFTISILFCSIGQCLAAEFGNSVGFGIQYGGALGWQGSISKNNLHGRISAGFPGLSVGADLNLSDYISIGATEFVHPFGQIHTLNINYHVSGKYTEGWRFSIDVGSARSSIFETSDKGNFTSISFGYSLQK